MFPLPTDRIPALAQLHPSPLLIALPSLLGISIVLFTVLALAPGDPFEELATNPNVPPEVRMALRAQFGLDDPVWQRYLHWLASMLKGDWGFSFVSRINVDQLIGQRIPVTLAVIGTSQLVALLVRCRWACWPPSSPTAGSTASPARWPSSASRCRPSSPASCSSCCSRSTWAGCRSSTAPTSPRPAGPGGGSRSSRAIMPMMVLGLFQAASWMRYVRSSVLDVIRLDYVTTARSKGLGERS
jgi:peptide/nickel transport system permease protein